MIFKGGTVLKKVYFEDYRFSEDLDFTLLDEKMSNEDLLKEFDKVYKFTKEKANITLRLKESDTHESGSLVFYINYIGPFKPILTVAILKSTLQEEKLRNSIWKPERLLLHIQISRRIRFLCNAILCLKF